jgi:hypothetical protein
MFALLHDWSAYLMMREVVHLQTMFRLPLIGLTAEERLGERKRDEDEEENDIYRGTDQSHTLWPV